MRSRYTAYALGRVDHLVRTWHPATRPGMLALDPDLVWERLEVTDVSGGGEAAAEGVVAFVAYWRRGGERGVLGERSTFVRRGGRWVYRDGVVS